MHPNIHSNTIYNSQDMKVTQESIKRWMDKEDVIYIYVYKILKDWNFAICSNVDGPREYYT